MIAKGAPPGSSCAVRLGGGVALQLLERDHDLAVLAAALDDASAGRGRVALIGGEAGIGKTAFVEHFIATCGRGARLLKGNCDALMTPTPLGPLHDIGRQARGKLLAQLDGAAPRAALFSTLLDQLRGPQPTLIVIEDLHWADDATLDLVRFLGRRIAPARALLVVTYRDDEIGARRALRLLLGDLATSAATVRIDLMRLTVDAVRLMIAGRPLEAAALHRQTAGNPFFVTEVLASAAPGIPRTVRDAVLARMARLGRAGRDLLQAAAVIGSPVEQGMLERVLGGRTDGLADCIAAGMLEPAGNDVAFRHELAREAVLQDIDPGRRRQLNRLALDALRGARIRPSDLARLVQYAEGAGDDAAVREYGLAAARAAAALGAHREAAAHYGRVLKVADDEPPAQRAALFAAYAEECAIIDQLPQAADAYRQAIGLWHDLRETLKEAEALAAFASQLVRGGQNAAADEAGRRAVEMLEAMPPTRQLASAYRIQAHLRMLDRDSAEAVRLGRKAIRLATRFADDAVIAAAENVVGSALLVTGDDRGRAHLDRSLALARQAGLDGLVGLAYTNLGSSYGEQYRFTEAERELTAGMAFTAERDLDYMNHYMASWLALTRLYQGRWSEASDIAAGLVARPDLSAISRIMALVALGRVRTRRGDPGAAAVLDEALDLAAQTHTLQRLAPVHAARAEAAWLARDGAGCAAEARAVYDLAIRHRHRWHAGELAFWRRLGGEAIAPPRWSAEPFHAQAQGDWQRSAAAWEHLGCPYEQARALAEGDPPAQIAALEIFDRLGAGPAAALLRQKMRGAGVRRIPRGPRASTRLNPFGLTARELQILACLARGLSNGRIGAELHVSPKTVDHHVSAVLAKLGAGSRLEAGRIARERQLLAQDREASVAK